MRGSLVRAPERPWIVLAGGVHVYGVRCVALATDATGTRDADDGEVAALVRCADMLVRATRTDGSPPWMPV